MKYPIIIVICFIAFFQNSYSFLDSTYSDHAEKEICNLNQDSLPYFEMKELYRWLEYPEISRRDSLYGEVILNVMINVDGKIADLKIVYADNKVLEDAALVAIHKVKFIPAFNCAGAYDSWITIPIIFRMKEKEIY